MAENLNSAIVIPARRNSTRLPDKMLLAETGRPLVVHTVEAAAANTKTDQIIVATDDDLIFETVEGFGHPVEMTSSEHQSGTDRVAEVARRHPEFEIVVNLQGDEPAISGAAIDLAIDMLQQNPEAMVSTLATPIRSRAMLEDPACVKVVLDSTGQALYFSRSPIPHVRGSDSTDPLPKAVGGEGKSEFLQHVGLYAYRRELLLKYSNLPPCPMETLESLEQLRVLFAGYSICVGIIDEPLCGIDTPEDYALFVRNWASG